MTDQEDAPYHKLLPARHKRAVAPRLCGTCRFYDGSCMRKNGISETEAGLQWLTTCDMHEMKEVFIKNMEDRNKAYKRNF